MTYRPDIDGLRAISVLAVFIYHLNPNLLPGGFVGVDIFFVISGYVITYSIYEQHKLNKFNLLNFYESRVRRLLPALVCVLLFSFYFSTAFYSNEDYIKFCDSLISALFFMSNWYFYSEAGYFFGPTEAKPLLHTWSLAIEEQFYLFYPILFIALISRKKNTIFIAFSIIIAFSFLWSLYQIYTGKLDQAFFDAVTRVWELLIGAVLALYKIRFNNFKFNQSYFKTIGLLLIFISIYFIEPTNKISIKSEWINNNYSNYIAYLNLFLNFPGLIVTLPIIGTILILYSGNKTNTISYKFITFKPLVYIGKISYGIYLWHWPILLYCQILFPDWSLTISLIIISLTFLVSIFSYHLIEMPIRRKTYIPSRKMIFSLSFIIILIILTITIISKQNLTIREAIFPSLKNKQILLNRFKYAEDSRQEAIRGDECHISNLPDSFEVFEKTSRHCRKTLKSVRNYLVIGDSHAADTWLALKFAYPQHNFLQLTSGGCRPERNIKVCKDLYEKGVQLIKENQDIHGVILTSRIRVEHLDPIIRYSNKFISEKVPVVVFGPTMEFKLWPQQIISYYEITGDGNKDLNSRKDLSLLNDDKVLREGLLKEKVNYVSKIKILCPNLICPIWTNNHLAIYTDSAHWTPEGAKLFGNRLLNQYPNIDDIFKLH